METSSAVATASPVGDIADGGDAATYITLAEAGQMVRKSARWVERHLTVCAASGAPAIIVVPSTGTSGRAAGKLVEETAWRRWLRTFEVARPAIAPTTASTRPIPAALLTPTQRRRLARGF